MARSIQAILDELEQRERALDRLEKREAFQLKVRLAREDWTPATRNTRLVGLQGQ